MSEPLPFGRWLKRLRADFDLSQEALAEAAGCAPQTIRAFESGTRRPSRAMVERLAAVLRVPVEEQATFARLARQPVGTSPPRAIAGDQPQGDDAGARGAVRARSSQATVEHSPILATKIYVPRPRPGLVSRPRLHARLEAGLSVPLTVIAASAGSGKTSVLADWLNRQEGGGCRVAWLALDAADSDPVQFLRYLIAALQTIAPRVGARMLDLLRADLNPRLEAVLPFLANDLPMLPERSILVLDDYHVIEAPAVHHVLQYVLDHLPPQLHLVIASRVDPPLPLARLRARAQLMELRAHDLRFTPEEAATFLREGMGLALSPEEADALDGRTEGWIAGLQLAALSLQNRAPEEMAQFIAAFSGSHRFVVDYLVEEVLARQPAHVQSFLLQTSILQRLSAPLCDAVVLGEASTRLDANAAANAAYSQLLLEDLERRNLFTVPLDNARHWYRYHHLFAQVLRERLTCGAGREAVLVLNRRAVDWLEQQELIDDAVRQAVAGGDLEHASALIERHGMALMERSEHVLVRRWVDQLPPALLETRPRLALVAGWLYAAMGRFEALDQLLATVMPVLDTTDVAMDLQGEVAVLRAVAARFKHQFGTALAFARHALTLLPADRTAGRARALATVGVCLLDQGDMAGADVALGEAIAVAQRGGHSALALAAQYWLATLYDQQGRQDDKLRTLEQAIRMARAVRGASLPAHGAAHIGIAEVWYERNDLERVQPLVTAGLTLLEGTIEHYVIGMGYVLLAHVQQACGNGDAALAALDEAAAWAARLQIESRQFHDLLGAYRTRVWLRQGNLAAALKWAATCGLDDELQLSDVRRLSLIRVRLAEYRAAPDHGALAELADQVARLLAMAEEKGWTRLRIELVMLQALLMQTQGDLGRALDRLASALDLAAPEGYVRLFVDEGPPMAALLAAALDWHGWGKVEGRQGQDVRGYARRLLAVFEAAGSDPRVGPYLPRVEPRARIPHGEVLTERELEVLQLLAAGHSNQAIAQQLVVAIGTVKRHVNSILGKLDVQSRLQAVARARELALL